MRGLDVRFPRSQVTVQDMVDHIDHVVSTIGVDHAAIGTDFNAGGGVTGFKGTDESVYVTSELVRWGYSEEEIGKIW